MSDDETKQTKKQVYDKQWRLDNKEHVLAYKKQWELDNPGYRKQHYLDNKEHTRQTNKRWVADNYEFYLMSRRFTNLKSRYGLTKEMFIKLYEEQGGLCLGCDIKIVSYVLPEERKQYEDDPNLIECADYAIAQVDHDHSFDIDGKSTGDPDSVRGLLCNSCNIKDVLNPESKCYIYGDDPTVKETLIKNREANIILKQWHKENS